MDNEKLQVNLLFRRAWTVHMHELVDSRLIYFWLYISIRQHVNFICPLISGKDLSQVVYIHIDSNRSQDLTCSQNILNLPYLVLFGCSLERAINRETWELKQPSALLHLRNVGHENICKNAATSWFISHHSNLFRMEVETQRKQYCRTLRLIVRV